MSLVRSMMGVAQWKLPLLQKFVAGTTKQGLRFPGALDEPPGDPVKGLCAPLPMIPVNAAVAVLITMHSSVTCNELVAYVAVAAARPKDGHGVDAHARCGARRRW